MLSHCYSLGCKQAHCQDSSFAGSDMQRCNTKLLIFINPIFIYFFQKLAYMKGTELK